MMNNEPTSADFEAARAATQLLVDSIPVNPGSVVVHLSEGAAINPRRFEMRIGSVILAHELEQAGVVLGSTTLEDFVREDLKGNRETAIQAYLGIVQAVVSPQDKGGFWGIFRTKEAEPTVVLWIQSVDEVYVSNEALVIVGVVESKHGVAGAP